jgi:hypothetical protein
MQQPDGTTESVRKAIAWLLTGGKMGEKGGGTLMGEVALAMQTTDLDQKRLGVQTWCETQKTKLVGFIRSRELTSDLNGPDSPLPIVGAPRTIPPLPAAGSRTAKLGQPPGLSLTPLPPGRDSSRAPGSKPGPDRDIPVVTPLCVVAT